MSRKIDKDQSEDILQRDEEGHLLHKVEQNSEGGRFKMNLDRGSESDFFDEVHELPVETEVFVVEPIRWPIFLGALFIISLGGAGAYGVFHLMYDIMGQPRGDFMYAMCSVPLGISLLAAIVFFIKTAMKVYRISKKGVVRVISYIPYVWTNTDSCDMVKIKDVSFNSVLGVANISIISRDVSMGNFTIPLVTSGQARLIEKFIRMYSIESITELATSRRPKREKD